MVTGLQKTVAYSIVCIIVLSFFCSSLIADLTSLAKNDPYPTFTALDPQVDRFPGIAKALINIRDEYRFRSRNDCFMISASAFGQNATRGRNTKGEAVFRRVPVELSTLTGNWSLFPLFFGNIPQGQTLPSTLQDAIAGIYGSLMPPVVPPPTPPIEEASFIDPNQRCGFLSFPLKYKKRGLRLSATWNIGGGVYLNVEGGIAYIRQSVENLPDPFCLEDVCTTTSQPACDFQGPDLTTFQINPEENQPPPFNGTTEDACQLLTGVEGSVIQQYLSKPFPCIAQQIDLDIGDFCKISSEEVRFNLCWTNIYEYARDSFEWAHLAIIPNFMLSVSVSPGKAKNEHKAFEPYFGNNRHLAIGASAGLYLDFLDTIQIGGEAGYTHFFSRTYCDLRIPNSKFQQSIYPFFTDAKVSPGGNTFFALKVLAYHFLDTLSAYVQYNIIDHKHDKICLVRPDPAFLPHLLEDVSCWSNKSINAGITYDILPNFGIGLLWQAPIKQRNSYKSTTIMLSVYGFF